MEAQTSAADVEGLIIGASSSQAWGWMVVGSSQPEVSSGSGSGAAGETAGGGAIGAGAGGGGAGFSWGLFRLSIDPPYEIKTNRAI